MLKGSIAHAVILMAGTGSRLRGTVGEIPKPLIPIAGRPVISYALDSLAHVGVRHLHIVVAPDAEPLVRGITPLLPAAISLKTIENSEWRKQNGISVLCAEALVREPFLLLMGDHLFDLPLLQTLLAHSDPSELNLAIDRKIAKVFDLDDAMKVCTEEGLVRKIGKDLEEFDAIDTGVFVSPPDLFEYLKKSRRDGDCGLADGVRLMAEDGRVRAIDIGASWWQDIDTPAMLRHANEILSRQAGAGTGTLVAQTQPGLARER